MEHVALIISLKFHPGHVSHMVASYRQFEELGYESEYLVDEGFVPYLPKGSRFLIYAKDKIPLSNVAIFLFPSLKNLFLIRKLKRYGTKVMYIFHEPLDKLSSYRNAGFSHIKMAKLRIGNLVNALIVLWSDSIIIPSQRAVSYYDKNSLYKNKNRYYIPLMYDDERMSGLINKQRLFFSYIGTVAVDHSFAQYLKFVEWAIKYNKLPQMQFLVATKSDFEVPELLLVSSRVTIIKGKPLTDSDINNSYASTYVVWNAYARTTQSGVLAKSFMFGTPAIVLRKHISEFVENGKEVVAIEDNTSFEQIENAVINIYDNFEHYSLFARKRFEESFYYRNYNDTMIRILSSN